MTYVDSDGVLADFKGWAYKEDPTSLNSREKMYKLMVYKKDSCFLASKCLHKNNMLIEMVAVDPEWFVLTSLPNVKDMMNYTGLTAESSIEVIKGLRENKFLWFEEHGVPRCKVIIVNSRREKLKYCHKGDVLYDDFEKTIEDWNYMGGIGILVE